MYSIIIVTFSIESDYVVPIQTNRIYYAFVRRERAYEAMASMKASAVALYMMHRDWDNEGTFIEDEQKRKERREAVKRELIERKRAKLQESEYQQSESSPNRSTINKQAGEGGGGQEVEITEEEIEKVFQQREAILAQEKVDRLQDVRKSILTLFNEVKLYLRCKNGLDSLFRAYVLLDELFVVR